MTDMLYPIIADVILVAIVVFVTWRSANRGFIRTIVELIGYILAATLSLSLSGVIADNLFEKNIRPAIVSSVESSLNDSTKADDITVAVENVWDEIPSYVTVLASMNGLNKDVLTANINKTVKGGTSKAATSLADNIIGPVVISAIKMMASLAIFIVVLFIVRLLARFLNGAFNRPVLRVLNRSLGGVLGLCKGAVIIFVIVALLGLALPLFSNKIWIITPEFIDRTYLFKLLYNSNPFLN